MYHVMNPAGLCAWHRAQVIVQYCIRLCLMHASYKRSVAVLRLADGESRYAAERRPCFYIFAT